MMLQVDVDLVLPGAFLWSDNPERTVHFVHFGWQRHPSTNYLSFIWLSSDYHAFFSFFGISEVKETLKANIIQGRLLKCYSKTSQHLFCARKILQEKIVSKGCGYPIQVARSRARKWWRCIHYLCPLQPSVSTMSPDRWHYVFFFFCARTQTHRHRLTERRRDPPMQLLLSVTSHKHGNLCYVHLLDQIQRSTVQ